MRWYLKSAGFKVLSALPGGNRLYRFAREHLTQSTWATPGRIRQKLNVGLEYWRWLEARGRVPALRQGAVLDFGAGWHPIIPLLYYSLGVPRQYLLDLAPWFAPHQIADTVRLFRELATTPGSLLRPELQRLPEMPAESNGDVAAILKSWGLSYHAPYPEQLDQFRGVADVAICTQVLLYIPPAGLRRCFQVIRDSLKPGGLFLSTVHLMDLYAHEDFRITPYNHLKFSGKFWERWVNSSMMSFNRLKARDYLELLREAGFKIVHQEVNAPTPEDYAQLDRVKVHPDFARYSREELAAKHLFFVAEKP
jgi:SAM-dependent methyltransferase